MIFSIQRYLEDLFESSGLRDADQYAINCANVYYRTRQKSAEDRLSAIRRIRTVFFRNNRAVDRKAFEEMLFSRLDKKFKKKLYEDGTFPGGTKKERTLLQKQSRLTIESLLRTFKSATEARAIDGFWKSRKQGILQSQPEAVGQGLFAVFASGTLANRSGLVLREVLSGIGFIDVMIVLSNTAHLVEIKVLRGGLVGTTQIEKYMQTENRRSGWLLLFDARAAPRSFSIPAKIAVNSGVVRTVLVDINPKPPSRI